MKRSSYKNCEDHTLQTSFHSVVQIHDFHLSTSYISTPIIYGLIVNPPNDQLPVGLIAPLVEHCTGIAEVRVGIVFRPEFFTPSLLLHKYCSKKKTEDHTLYFILYFATVQLHHSNIKTI